ncbi:CRISPR-associated endoribonuclease Cas6 [Moorella sp. Hama-1]|uniref:CRISPR-associated endoribonuclease Cas6 n=1 Tax=Moorella sp. Hama-1 TaxID=2138101 RepID=UPI00137B78DF|nr:CRISPR-associated endoribonuclease Cas6 [Moorella sp. Hama-1]BCV20315.1 hypothetical protein hamaS1_03840 [Moorella sp. Hama-1]
MINLRLLIILEPVKEGGQELTLPLDFRRHFISLLKTLAGTSPLAQRFTLAKPGYSPYVFSVGFNRITALNTPENKMTCRPPLFMTISTGIFDVMTALVNGAVALKGQETVLGLYLKDVLLQPLKQIQSTTQKFRIQSHAILRGPSGYIDGSGVEEMEEAINTHLCKRHSFLVKEYHLENMRLNPVQVITPSHYHKGVCFHYGGELTTIQGHIHLQANPATLQFLYDYGLGVRTGQGFGLLEVDN